MSKKDVWYYIMDGRAHHDVDRAIVCDTCNTFEEAMIEIEFWPDDFCIVRDDTWEILYSPMWGEKPL